MQLIDTHAHLTAGELHKGLEAVLARAAAAGVGHVITVASDARDAARCVDIAREHPNVSATAGIHPHEAAKVLDGDFARLAELLGDPQVVACGEIGLDYHYDFADHQTQQRVFGRQLELAGGLDLPLVIHCREAFDDCIGLLETHGFRGRMVIFHCFTSGAAEAEELADRGWRISFTGIVTFKNSTALQAIARGYPADKLMLETDCPYLSPVPVRHVRPNEPGHLRHTAEFLADLRGVSLDELAAQTSANARRFFNLEQSSP